MKTGQLICLRLLLFCIFWLIAGVALAEDTTSIVGSNEQKAREHYVAGEAALKSGDRLTAVVELEAALRLKPSSTFSAKLLATAAAKLGDDGKLAYAHYINAGDLEAQNKLDDAGKELDLALSYRPNGLTPQCLTAKSMEIADLVKASKPAVDVTAASTSATKAATKSTTSTSKKTTSAKSTSTKPKTTTKKSTTTKKASRPPVYHPPTSHLSYVHGYRINGRYVPGHYVMKVSHPTYLPPPP